MRIEHDYTIEIPQEGIAILVDTFVNHQVLIDPDTKEPIEADPNEQVVDVVRLRRDDGVWKVSRKDRA